MPNSFNCSRDALCIDQELKVGAKAVTLGIKFLQALVSPLTEKSTPDCQFYVYNIYLNGLREIEKCQTGIPLISSLKECSKNKSMHILLSK
jgi:hypothetical protein